MTYETIAPTLQYERTYIVTYKDKYDVEDWEQLLRVYKGWNVNHMGKYPTTSNNAVLDHKVSYRNNELEANVYVIYDPNTDSTPYADIKRLFAGEDLVAYRMGPPKDFVGKKTEAQILRSILEPKRADRINALYTECLHGEASLLKISPGKSGGIKLVVHITENICLVTHNSSLWSLEEDNMKQLMYSIPENKMYLRDEKTETLTETKEIEIIRYEMPK